MQDDLAEFIQLLLERDKEYEIHIFDPEDLYKFDIRWKLLHQRHRILNGARLLLPETEE